MRVLQTALIVLLGIGAVQAAAPRFAAGIREAVAAELKKIPENQQLYMPIGPPLTCTDNDGDSVTLRIPPEYGGEYFGINPFQKTLFLKQKLDYESMEIDRDTNRLKVRIICEENTAEKQQDVIEEFLYILDVNDNSPMFVKLGSTGYYVVISENTLPGTVIYTNITVTDADGSDNNIIEAVCVQECDLFRVVSNKTDNGVYQFIISTIGSVRGGKPSYTMVISAQDRPRSANQTSLRATTDHNVVIVIQDIQDLPPKFAYLPLSFTIPENQALNVGFDKKIGAFDQDKGDPNDIVFELLPHPDDPDTFNDKLFILGPTNPEVFARGDTVFATTLILNKPVDRERIQNSEKVLRLRVKAQEVIPPRLLNTTRIHNPQSAEENITIEVTDVNDEIPAFDKNLYEIEFNERVTTADRNRWHQVSNRVPIYVNDLDGRINNRYIVEFIQGNEDNMFRLDSYEGTGKTQFRLSAFGEILDYEEPRNRQRRLLLRATDLGRPTEFFSTAEVLFTLRDVNDHFPRFEKPSYVFSINEGDYRGNNNLIVGTVMATDKDSGTFGQIVKYEFENTQPKFTIDNNGVITAIDDIDYDQGNPSYAMTVIAYDGGEGQNQRSLGVAVQIFIVNVPDVGPRFRQSYVTNITEVETTLRPAINLVAEDLEGIGEITYSIKSTTPSLPGYFQIPNPRDGRLILTRTIDFKQTIVSGPVQNTSGVVVVEAQACISGGNKQLCTTTNVLVYVTDLNNSPPEFIPTNVYRFNLSELAQPGDEVIQVFTRDNDSFTDPLGDNARVRYRLGGGSREHFQIEEDSGMIIVSRLGNRLDVDTFPTYDITVIAQDYGNPTMSSSANVIINLMDANNKDPTFLQSTYFLSVKDDATVGFNIGPVLATDPDSGHVIEYSIDYANLYVEVKGERRTSQNSILPAKEAIGIDKTTGMIKTMTLLDRNLYEVINFGVIAEDVNIDRATQPIQTATASVILTVLGSDDVRPYYRAPGWTRENPNIKMTRPETNEIGWTLYSLTAFDPKTGELISRFEKIDGTDPNGFFKIEGRIIYVTQKLDYEDGFGRPNGDLTVGVRAWANDNVRYVDANIILTVKDVNDNFPIFSKTQYNFPVEENAVFGTQVGTVYASDKDSGSFGQLRYRLEGPNSDHFFVITNTENQEATIYVNKDITIDYETFSEYVLYITATDNPELPGETRPSNEQQRSTSAVFISVIDKNDNAPICTKDLYEYSVIGTKSIGQLKDSVKATDADEGSNGDIFYTMSPQTDRNATYYFGIDTSIEGSVSPEKVGRITVRKSLRALPDESKFTLLVVATDSAPQDEQLTTTCTAVITVSKGVIDPKPRWDPRLSSKVYVPEDKLPPFSIANVTAQPANLSSSIVYNFITRGDTDGDYNSFHLDPLTGHVTLAKKLDYETKDEYNLRIQATDVSNDTLTNSFLLTVLVVDVEDNKPAFNACRDVEYDIPVPVSVREDEPIDTYVYTAVACDRDSHPYNKMRYSWHLDSVLEKNIYCRREEMNKFKIDETTGVIRTQALLDRETQSHHLLCVKVAAMGRRKRSMESDLQDRTNHHEVLYILVNVLDANDEGPHFVEDPILNVILEYPLEYVVAKAHAVDLDISPNNLIRYTIESIIYTKGRKSYNTDQAFNINTRDGVISIGTYDYSDFVGGYFNITVVAEDATGEYQGSDKMTVMIYVSHSSQQIRVVFNQPADETVETKVNKMIGDLNNIGETGVFYRKMSIGPHIVSNAEDPVYSRTDVCLVIVKDDVALSSLDAVKRLSNEQRARQILTENGAIEPGPCEPARSVYPEGWESYWWVLVAFAIFIFVITLILIIIVCFLYKGYRNYMDSHKTYLVSN